MYWKKEQSLPFFPMQTVQLILVDPQPMLCHAWKTTFQEFEDVSIVNDYFENLPEFDCMVSAANSFGLMDGGVDLAIINFYGHQLEKQIQTHIIAEYQGEQPVGTCFLFPTGHPKHPFVAHAPTMRVPMSVDKTDNVYLAMKALLEAVRRHNLQSDSPINTIACPGLGTATGRVPYPEAARQMALAYRNFLQPPTRIDWNYATERQRNIRYGGNLFGL